MENEHIAETGAAEIRSSLVDLRDLPDWPLFAARDLLFLVTFYGMKERARTTGEHGLSQLLRQIHVRRSTVPIHLVGHSFGGLVISAAAAAGRIDTMTPIQSLRVCQGAYSHYSYARKWDNVHDGIFRTLIDEHRVRGPLLVGHTRNDKPLLVLYNLAARVSGTTAPENSGVSPYVALGTDGAQQTPEAVHEELLSVGKTYKFLPGTVHNLRSDKYVLGHNGWVIPEVAYAVLNAMTA